MEYFLGSVITMVAMFFATKLISSEKKVVRENPFRYSQSHIHEIVSPLIPHLKEYKKVIKCQSRNQEEKTNEVVTIQYLFKQKKTNDNEDQTI